MTDYAECPWCHVSSSVTDRVLDRKCHHAIMTYGEGSTFKGDVGTIIRFSTPDRLENKDILCVIRSTMTDERFLKSIEVMDIETVEEIEIKLAHRKAELQFNA